MPNAYPPQTNQTRFNFTQRQISSAGQPPVYDVIDGGGSLNSAGFVGSCSGQTIGQIIFDPIMKRWGFQLDKKAVPLDPNQNSAGGADAKEIATFIGTLAIPTSVAPIVQ